MRELSLFSGAGGGLLGTLLLGWTPIGYVEYDDYCQRVIAQRIADGVIPAAPIFGDVREFIRSGAAAEYRGFADVVTGGFPCQPFSVAGKQLGADDPRNMWPATSECVRIIRPRFCFFENVPALLTSGYFGTIIGDLAACGYGVRWRVLSAAEMGAPHKRDRLWIVAHPSGARGGLDSGGIGESSGQGRQSPRPRQSTMVRQENGSDCAEGIDASCRDVSNAAGQRTRKLPERQGRQEQAASHPNGVREDVAHADGGCSQREEYSVCPGRNVAELGGQNMADAECYGCQQVEQSVPEGTTGKRASGQVANSGVPRRGGWWEVEPNVGRVVNGVASRVDRLRAIGNGQVPAVVRAAWHLLATDSTSTQPIDDFAELEEYWPSLEEMPDGVDVFAEKYGPPTGEPQP